MTELTRVVRRRVATVRGTPLVVALAPEGIWIREPRRRTAYLLPYGHAFVVAAKLAADQLVRERKAARQARRGGAK